MDYHSLGKKIRHFRTDRELTQEDLAMKAGISPSFLGHIERGSRKASLETLIHIANAMQVGTDRLLADSLNHGIVGGFTENQRRYMAEILQILLTKIES